MIRVVLAVLLAAALLGVALPAVDAAAEAQTERTAERNAARLADAATALAAASDPSEPGVPGARTTVHVEFPEPSLAADGLAYLAVGGHPNRTLERDTSQTDVLVYRVAGEPSRTVRLPTDVRTAPNSGDADPLVLRGDATLELGYVLTPTGPAITVSRVPRFKREKGTTSGQYGSP